MSQQWEIGPDGLPSISGMGDKFGEIVFLSQPLQLRTTEKRRRWKGLASTKSEDYWVTRGPDEDEAAVGEMDTSSLVVCFLSCILKSMPSEVI